MRQAADVRPPCAGSTAWTGEDRDARARAARLCRNACPLLARCGAYADAAGETWGVYGGRDYDPREHDDRTTTSTTDERSTTP